VTTLEIFNEKMLLTRHFFVENHVKLCCYVSFSTGKSKDGLAEEFFIKYEPIDNAPKGILVGTYS